MILSTVDQYIEADLVHSIHVSERKSFRGCRRRWAWIYRDLYYPTVTAKPLEFGIAFHKAMEHWFDPNAWGVDDASRELETLRVFMLECERQKKEYLAKIRAQGINEFEEMNPEVEADYNERVELGQAMLQNMFKVSYEIDAEYRPVGVETSFEVPIVLRAPNGPFDSSATVIWCKCHRCWSKWKASAEGIKHHDTWQEVNWKRIHAENPSINEEAHYREEVWQGLPVTLGGRIDAIFQDRHGRYWIVDWKTAARLSTGDPGAADDYLYLDDQITSYCYALWLLGIDVAGFIYHEIKKVMVIEPEPMKHRRKGLLFSTSKSAGFDYETYKKVVEENDPGMFAEGGYDEFLQYLKEEGSTSYKRHIIHRSQEELIQAGQTLALEALDLTDPNLRVYPNPGRFSCSTCAFREPCLGMNRGEDVQFTLDSLFEKRTKLYYETALPSTDKPSVG